MRFIRPSNSSVSIIAASAVALLSSQAKADEPAPFVHGVSSMPLMHEQRPPVVAMLLYPGMTLLDTLGPHTTMCTTAKTHLVWKNLDPIITDSGIMITPDTTFENCPKDLDVLFVGGGSSTVMEDPEAMKFLADRGSRAKWITSVCGGSIVLGKAGLMAGYEATTHWAAMDSLPRFGAKPVHKRVVIDRNRISGGGVTAGIDFGLVLISKLLDEKTAKLTQLAMEYDPQPPFSAGSPEGAGPELVAEFHKRFAPMMGKEKEVIQKPVEQLDSPE